MNYLLFSGHTTEAEDTYDVPMISKTVYQASYVHSI